MRAAATGGAGASLLGAHAVRLRGTDGTGLGPHSARSHGANENPTAAPATVLVFHALTCRMQGVLYRSTIRTGSRTSSDAPHVAAHW
jgi:hypothetical protein